MLDQMMEGFEEIDFLEVMQSFPEEIAPLFVKDEDNGTGPTVEYLLSMLKMYRARGEEVFNFLKEYVTELDEKGIIVAT